jgi:hypothetical protein
MPRVGWAFPALCDGPDRSDSDRQRRLPAAGVAFVFSFGEWRPDYFPIRHAEEMERCFREPSGVHGRTQGPHPERESCPKVFVVESPETTAFQRARMRFFGRMSTGEPMAGNGNAGVSGGLLTLRAIGGDLRRISGRA